MERGWRISISGDQLLKQRIPNAFPFFVESLPVKNRVSGKLEVAGCLKPPSNSMLGDYQEDL